MSLNVPAIEKALLTGKWDDELLAGPSSTPEDAPPVLQIARNVVNGDFRDLRASPSRDLFAVTQSGDDDVDGSFLDRPLAEWFKFSSSSTAGTGASAEEELLRLTCAVACLHAFIQANWTGPDLEIKPLEVLALPTELEQLVSEDVLHQKAVSELAHGGEPAYHLAKAPIFLQLARLLLFESGGTGRGTGTFQHCRSAPWWRLRVWRVHLQVLDEPVAVPAEVLGGVSSLLDDGFAAEPDLAGRLLLEQGLLEHCLGHDKSAAEYFVRAARATELEYELSGAPGRRTKFQQFDVTQLVLLAESRVRGDSDGSNEEKTQHDQHGETRTTTEGSSGTDPAVPETLLLNDDTLLEQTAFTSSAASTTTTTTTTPPGSRLAHIDPASQPALHPLDQSILLALCLNVKNTSPAHGLTAEQMTPYVARVLAHPRNWTVHTMALLLRSRLEAHRTRTVERAVLQLQALVDQMPTADSSASERLLYVHELVLPSRWEMERELAARYVSIGVVKSALEIFERLEMWEEVARCWASLERPEKALAVVRDLLEGRKAEADAVRMQGKALSEKRRSVFDAAREAKLWCLLGDLEPAHALEHYQRAWEVSRGSSGRAMRSLGGYYFARGRYAEAVESLRRAVGINPLQARAWFVLGCACLRVEDWEGARDAFVRCVTIDDEDGESWNNLASVYMRMGEAGKAVSLDDGDDDDGDGGDNDGDGGAAQAATANGTEAAVADAGADGRQRIPFANKLLAFRALRQGLRVSYENWRMWANYMVVAMDVGELAEASRALARVVEERADKDGAACVDADVLDRLVDAVARDKARRSEAAAAPSGDDDVGGAARAAQATNLERRVADLFERTILPRVSSPRIFRARARLLTAEGRYGDALNAYLDAYRAGPAGTMEKGETDVGRWRAAVGEVEEIVDVLRNFGPRVAEGFNWKLQARSIVRTFMGRTRDFEDEPEWARLVALQEEIKKEE